MEFVWYNTRRMGIPGAVATVVESIALSYGFTLAIWSCGALAILKYGAPKLAGVLLFITGAMLGFLLFDIPTWWSVSGNSTVSVTVPSIALLNVFPLVVVVASSLVIRQIRSPKAGFFFTGLAATTLYIVSLSLLIAVMGG